MQLISEVGIRSFRSLSDARLGGLGHFTAIAGLNNAGKSNVLRALNAFFTGRTDGDKLLSVDQDYFRPHLTKKKAKAIRVGVRFSLPTHFNFQKSIQGVRSFLGGPDFEISKEWTRGAAAPAYFLNGRPALDPEGRAQVDQFLSLISFRYIPNRVLPLDIIRGEHGALRDVLIRRFAKRVKGRASDFEVLEKTSANLIKSINSHVKESCPGVGDVRLATPRSWKDMVFAFGYKLASGEVEIDDALQGSGIQSLLMLETLALIDRDYFQQFGWRQAAIWALEEPESSLHSSLEAKVSAYLAQVSTDPKGRLQVLATTHSDLVLQHADATILASQELDGSTTLASVPDKFEALEQAARLGVSRWTHPILAFPLDPVVLVEGKYDQAFVEQGLALLAPANRMRICHLDQLLDGAGGSDALVKYVRSNLRPIRTRAARAPVIVVLDWDSEGKKKEIEKFLKPGDPCQVFVWPASTFNPKLSKAFHGIERHMTNRLITAADKSAKVVGTRKDGLKTINQGDYAVLKNAIFEQVRKGLKFDDLKFARPFLGQILQVTQ